MMACGTYGAQHQATGSGGQEGRKTGRLIDLLRPESIGPPRHSLNRTNQPIYPINLRIVHIYTHTYTYLVPPPVPLVVELVQEAIVDVGPQGWVVVLGARWTRHRLPVSHWWWVWLCGEACEMHGMMDA